MNPALVTMIVLGCNHGEADCNFIREVETRFETEAACQMQADAVLSQTKQSDYPVVMVVCEKQENWQMAENVTSPANSAGDTPHVVMAPDLAEPQEPKKPGKIRRFAKRVSNAAKNFGHVVADGFRAVFSPRKPAPTDPIELGRQG